MGSRAEALISSWSSETGIFKLPSCQPSCSSWLLQGWPSGKTELRGGQREEPHGRGCRLVSCFWLSVHRTPGSARGLWPPPTGPQGLPMAGAGATQICSIPPAIIQGRLPRPTLEKPFSISSCSHREIKARLGDGKEGARLYL